jgi:hypothetical protein
MFQGLASMNEWTSRMYCAPAEVRVCTLNARLGTSDQLPLSLESNQDL